MVCNLEVRMVLRFPCVFVVLAALINNVLPVERLCVKGRLECRTNPQMAANVRIKLYDEDDGPNPDDLMADGHSDQYGNFELCGQSSDLVGSIDPVFKVYHDCDDGSTPCMRKAKFKIGKQYLGGTYEFANGLDLTIHYPGEERKCIQLP